LTVHLTIISEINTEHRKTGTKECTFQPDSSLG